MFKQIQLSKFNYLGTLLIALGLYCVPYVSRADAGRDAGFQFCQSLDFSSNQSACAKVIADAEFVSVDGINICYVFSFDSKKIDCAEQVVNNDFDREAAAFCKNDYDFDSNIMDCVGAVKNKSYVTSELSICRDKSFDSEKTECLRTLGRDYDDLPPGGDQHWKKQMVRRLKVILHHLKNGNVSQAIRSINETIDDLEGNSTHGGRRR